MPAHGPGRVRPAFETAVLLATVVALLLPTAAGAAALAGLILLWLAARPARQERFFVGVALSLSALALLVSVLGARRPPASPEEWRLEVEAGFAGVFDQLAAAARHAAASFEQPPAHAGDRRDEFELLARLLPADADGLTLLLLAPERGAVAWAGEGVLHEGDLRALPPSGFAYRQGYTAVTVFAIEPLPGGRRPWRLVAGRSLATDRLPFATSAVPRTAVQWALGPHDSPAPAGVSKIEHGDAPAVFVEPPGPLDRRPLRLAGVGRNLGTGLLGLTLLALALVRAGGDRLLGAVPRRGPPPGLPLLALAGTVALASAAELQRSLSAALAAAVALAAWGLLRRRATATRAAAGVFGGGLTPALLILAAVVYQHWMGPKDLGSSLVVGADAFALRLVFCLTALGLSILAARRATDGDGDAAAWWAVLLLLAAGAACDFPQFAVPLSVLAGVAVVRWLGGVDFSRRPTALGALLVLAALAGSVSWEIAYREVFRRELGARILADLAPATADERNDLQLMIHRHFEGRSLAELPASVGGPVDPRDLAFVLWRDSPLAQRDALSALAVETRDGQRSSFSFGLSLDEDFVLVPTPETWSVPPVPAWNRVMIQGEVPIELASAAGVTGRVAGVVRYWLLLRPGFRLDVDEIGELAEALLRGGPRSRVLDGLPPGVLYGLYDQAGLALTSPWEEAPPLPPPALESGASVATPAGRSWVFADAGGGDGIRVLFLPRLTPRAGLERVGTHALGSLVWITAIALVALGVALPRSAQRGLVERTVRSYSKRMILVYTVLLLLPLIALNLVLLRSFADRERREQRAAAQSAISSARLFLLNYLRGLELGFDLETQVNSALMEWIAGFVEHPVNFYWNSQVFASSQQELFTAGLLPRRIPGEVFSRLALAGYKIGVRRQERGGVDYLELYAPLDIDESSVRQGLFLSVPLLEQEEEVARELAVLRRRALLVTSALVMLLFAVGSRLARGFTKPLMEIIAGTRRIAAGAPFLEVTPREHELEALADAIDDMARRIDEGRRKLVVEKQVVERIVESITSGVVSLDLERRVLLQNRVAAELLGTEIGEPAARTLERDPRLRPVLRFLTSAGETSAQTTVELRDPEGAARQWTLTWVPIPGVEAPAALLVVDDATEVLRGQRLEAWAEMARIIAHEIKNPLTPIRLSADHMRQVYRADREKFDEVFERCTGNILKQVEELSDIASDFSIYSRIPRAELAEGDLVEALGELVEGYREAAIVFRSDVPQLRTRFDPKLLGRAVRNVIENALRASARRGRVELSLESDGDSARIRVVDSGPGVDPDFLRRIFEPYFSTYESGTGLGLAITRRIVEEHAGRIEAANRPSGGLEVEITIPLAAAPTEVRSAETAP